MSMPALKRRRIGVIGGNLLGSSALTQAICASLQRPAESTKYVIKAPEDYLEELKKVNFGNYTPISTKPGAPYQDPKQRVPFYRNFLKKHKKKK